MSTHLTEARFTILRYHEDPARQEPRNLGVVLHAPEQNFVRAIFATDLRKRIGSSTNPDIVDAYIDEIKDEIENPGNLFDQPTTSPGPDYLVHLWETYSGKLDFSEPLPILVTDPQKEAERLFGLYVGAPRRYQRRSTDLRKDLRNALKRRGLLGREKVRPGVHLKVGQEQIRVDFAYFGPKTVVVEAIDLTDQPLEWRIRMVSPAAMKLRMVREHHLAQDTYAMIRVPASTNGAYSDEIGALRDVSTVLRFDTESETLFDRLRRDMSGPPLMAVG